MRPASDGAASIVMRLPEAVSPPLIATPLAAFVALAGVYAYGVTHLAFGFGHGESGAGRDVQDRSGSSTVSNIGR